MCNGDVREAVSRKHCGSIGCHVSVLGRIGKGRAGYMRVEQGECAGECRRGGVMEAYVSIRYEVCWLQKRTRLFLIAYADVCF